jgi:hypothetical protein
MMEAQVTVTATVYTPNPNKANEWAYYTLSVDGVAEHIVNNMRTLCIDEEVFQSTEKDDHASALSIGERDSSIFTTNVAADEPIFYDSFQPHADRRPFLIINRTGKIEEFAGEDASLADRLLRCNRHDMPDLIRKACQAEYDRQMEAKQIQINDDNQNKALTAQKNARWWKSLRSSFASLGPLNPSNFALLTLFALSIGLVIAKCAPLAILTAAAPTLGYIMMGGAAAFGATLLFVAPFLLYEHYTAQRYKYWVQKRKAELVTHLDGEAQKPNLSYQAYLNDKRFDNTLAEDLKLEFGFVAYLDSIYTLAKENKIKAIMILGAIAISGLLALASVGFIYGAPVAQFLMQPFFDVMSTFLTEALGSFIGAHTIQILAHVLVPLFPLVIADTARRIIELFEKADTDSKNPKYGTQKGYLENRPKYDSSAGMTASLKHSLAETASSFKSVFGRSSDIVTFTNPIFEQATTDEPRNEFK